MYGIARGKKSGRETTESKKEKTKDRAGKASKMKQHKMDIGA